MRIPVLTFAALLLSSAAGLATPPAAEVVKVPPPPPPETGNFVFMSPFCGYSPVNYNKKVRILDRDGKNFSTRPGDLSFPLMDLINRAGEKIDIACYLYGVYTGEHAAVVRAIERGVKVRLFLDESIKDKDGVPVINKVIEKIRADRLPIEAKVIDPVLAEKATGLPFKTMHEKFGVVDGAHVFTGSANIEIGSNVKYAEDRFFFLNNPRAAAEYQAEFERLWAMGKWVHNPHGGADAPPERAAAAPPAPAARAAGGIESRFNSVERLERYVKETFSEAVVRAQKGAPAAIDIMTFSFTSPTLADSLLRIARDYPSVRIRIIANLSQLFREPTSVVPDIEAIASGKVEAYRTVAERRRAFIKDPEERNASVESEFKQVMSEYRQKPLPNIELKYKWFPSFSWEPARGKADYDHFHPKSSLLHHKAAIINGETLVTGSYNWSNYAETKNLENLLIVRGEADRKLVTDFLAEFEAMWNDPSLAKTSAECMELKERICAELEREHAKDPTPGPAERAAAEKARD